MFRIKMGDLLYVLDRTYLYPGGSQYKYFRNRIIVVYVVAVLLLSNFTVTYAGFKKSLNETLFYVVIGYIANGQQLYFVCNEDRVRRLLQLLDRFQDGHQEQWQKTMFQKDSEGIWKQVKYHFLACRAYTVFYMILPFVLDLAIGLFKPDFPEVLRVPVPCQGLIDLTQPRSAPNICYSLLGIIWAIISIGGHIGTETLIYVSLIYVKSELKMVKRKLELAKESLHGARTAAEVGDIIRPIVQHHTLVLESLDTVIDTLGFPIALQNAFSICFCINLYVLNIYGSENNLMLAVESVAQMGIVATLLFSLCQIGESLGSVYHEIFNAIYDLPWYEMEPRFRGDLVMMIRQSRKAYVINFHRNGNLNLHSFMQIMNASYSYFMMLKSTAGD